MSTKVKEILHTDSLLRKHGLLLVQQGFGEQMKFRYIDWQTHRSVGKQRIEAFEKEAFGA